MVLHIELLGSSLLHSTQNSTWHTGATETIIPVLLAPFSHLTISSHCGQHKRQTEVRSEVPGKGKGEGPSPKFVSKVEKLNSLGHGNRSSHDSITEENSLGRITP